MRSKGEFSLSRSHHLTLTKDFDYLRSESSKVKAGEISVYFKKSRESLPFSRLAFSIGKKVGNSVVRHRLKRIATDIFRRDKNLRSLCFDMLIVISNFQTEEKYKTSLSHVFERIKTEKPHK